MSTRRGTSSVTPPRRQHLPDWQTFADLFGLVICPGPPEVHCGASYDMHRYGFVRAETPPTVHWSLYGTKSHENPRLPTRKGLYLFLKLCYRALHPEVWTMPIWQRIYEESSAAIAAGLRGGVRIGRRLTALDRAKVRAALADPADRDTPLKERAWRWSEK